MSATVEGGGRQVNTSVSSSNLNGAWEYRVDDRNLRHCHAPVQEITNPLPERGDCNLIDKENPFTACTERPVSGHRVLEGSKTGWQCTGDCFKE